jgi:MFS family permease
LTSLQQGGSTNVNPGLDAISKALGLPPETVSLVSTLPSLCAVAACLFIGRFAGREIRYKTIMVASLALSVAAGSFPLFFPTQPARADVSLYWYLILASRVIVGLGTGVFFTLPSVLVQRFYTGDKQKKNLGLVSAFGSVSGLPAMLAAGFLVDINWTYIFGVYLAGILPLFLVIFFLPEPEPVVSASPAQEVKQKIRWPLPVILNFILIFLACTFWSPALIFMSNIVIGRGLGNGFQSGIASVMFDISPFLLSFLLKYLYGKFGRFLVVVCLAVSAVGMFLVYDASSLFEASAGMFLLGSIMLLIPSLILDNRPYLQEQQVTSATSGLTLCFNLGLFAGGPFSSLASVLCKSIPFAGLLFGFVGLAVICAVCFVLRLTQRPALS